MEVIINQLGHIELIPQEVIITVVPPVLPVLELNVNPVPINGVDGVDGVDGKSAYALAVENGFVGSEQEWLNSFKDWEQIINKPNFGTASLTDSEEYATSLQGSKADTAVQPNQIANFETTSQLDIRDTNNRNRSNHTGTQPIDTINNLQATLAGKQPLGDYATNTALTDGLASKETIINKGSILDYYRGDKTWQPLTKNLVGLANVDNTSDLDKPTSNATQTALNQKINIVDSSELAYLNSPFYRYLSQYYMGSYLVGEYYTNAIVAYVKDTEGNTNSPAGRIDFYPFFVFNSLNIDRLAITVRTANTGLLYKFSLYLDNGSNILQVSSTYDFDASTTGIKEFTITPTISLLKSNLYYLGLTCNNFNNGALEGFGPSLFGGIVNSVDRTMPVRRCNRPQLRNFAYASTLPTTVSKTSLSYTSPNIFSWHYPYLLYRVASLL